MGEIQAKSTFAGSGWRSPTTSRHRSAQLLSQQLGTFSVSPRRWPMTIDVNISQLWVWGNAHSWTFQAMSMLFGSSLGMTCLLSLLVKASKSSPVPANPVWANLANTLITAAMDGVPIGPAMVKSIFAWICVDFCPRLPWISGRSRLTLYWTFRSHRERYKRKKIYQDKFCLIIDHISDMVGASKRICS